MRDRAKALGGFIKIEHTLFSLPLLFAGAWLGASGYPGLEALVLVVLAGAGARTAAMALNRIIDRDLDRLNPRTRTRELPAGRISLAEAAAVAAAGSAIYLLVALYLGGLCAVLWPVPLIVFTLYPYLKRWTSWCHVGVGMGLAMGPLGGALAVRPESWPGWEVWMLAVFTLLWVTGFDIIYATLDEDADRRQGLYSAVVLLGREGALKLSAFLHLAAFLCLAVLVQLLEPGVLAIAMLVLIAVVLAVEHLPGVDPYRAFFHCNVLVGFAVLGAILGA